ncbi:hypothetical protein [Streptomyces sp. NPDC086838]|uniref:hypothetical protein n=1 Tax=Streptomyces sp. NPDC086838 TaxID=3365762 RepID=UPI0037F41331
MHTGGACRATVRRTLGATVRTAVVDARRTRSATVRRTLGATVRTAVVDARRTRSATVRGAFRPTIGTAVVDARRTRSATVRGAFRPTIGTAVVDARRARRTAVRGAFLLVRVLVGTGHGSSRASNGWGPDPVPDPVVRHGGATRGTAATSLPLCAVSLDLREMTR